MVDSFVAETGTRANAARMPVSLEIQDDREMKLAHFKKSKSLSFAQ
ncbi:hypothetical protein [Pseudacidovorax intermedius]|nr:hypothetical protein [Pseudacidovorax intermedius]